MLQRVDQVLLWKHSYKSLIHVIHNWTLNGITFVYRLQYNKMTTINTAKIDKKINNLTKPAYLLVIDAQISRINDLTCSYWTVKRPHFVHLQPFINSDSPALYKIQSGREAEIGITLSDEWWDDALKAINLSPSCVRLSLIQFKILHRIHFNKARLSKIFPNLSDTCDRCCQARANFTHMIWSFPSLVEYWRSFFDVISKILDLTLVPLPPIAIFGIPG